MIDWTQEDDGTQTSTIWSVFADLMAGLLGAFVLVLVGVLVVQMELANHLKTEVARRQQEEQRRQTLEQALAGPMASGRITVTNGRIGISGSVLFAPNSAALQPSGAQLLKSLVTPLKVYLHERNELLMISGFTDDTPVRNDNERFTDNLDLSAQRAMTVTRALMAEGMPAEQVFAAAFGPTQPVAANTDEKGRAQNRRVELAPVPRASNDAARSSN